MHAGSAQQNDFFARAILAKSAERVASYQRRGEWNVYRSLKILIENAIGEYEHRTLLELLQNAHDAHHPGQRDGRIAIALAENEGEHGTIYVANDGRPFSVSNFDSICGVAESDKNPDEGIGNKGIGFKSVLQLSRTPQIYSRRDDIDPTITVFDGFCFTFASGADFLTLAGGDAELAADLQRDVFHLVLPVPMLHQPDGVRRFANDGYATVIRLPLKSPDALTEARRELEALRSDPPALLFLRRIRELLIERTTARDREAVLLERSEERIAVQDPVVNCTTVCLGDERFHLFEKTVPVARLREAIQRGIDADRMSEKWADWHLDGQVTVALSTDERSVTGRLYAFLPMGSHAFAPLAAHLNAPFFSKLGRVDLEGSIPINSMLLAEAADLCARAAVLVATSGETFAPGMAIDLVGWEEETPRIVAALQQHCGSLAHARVVPLSQPRGTWAGLGGARTWPVDVKVFTAPLLNSSSHVPILDLSVGERRVARLDSFSRRVGVGGLEPSSEQIAGWSEAAAKRLAGRRFDPDLWADFYDDLAILIPVNEAAALAGRHLLIDDDCRLHPTLSTDGDHGTTPFFSPRSDEGAGDNPDVDLRPPASLRHRIFFVHQGLRWNVRSGAVLNKRPGRRLLENGLVNEYRASELFVQLRRVLSQRKGRRLYADALRWVYSLAQSRKDPPWAEIRDVDLMVPLKSGEWGRARSAVFSAGWEAEHGRLLEELIDAAGTVSREIAALRAQLIADPGSWPFHVRDVETLKRFLDQLGVQSGLSPVPVEDSVIRATGYEFEQLFAASRLSRLTARAREDWERSLKFYRPTGLRPQTAYVSDGPMYVLPGQDDFEKLDDGMKTCYARLVLAGLSDWARDRLVVSIRRYNDSYDSFQWPTPIRAFLRETDWLPVQAGSGAAATGFARPRNVWTYSSSEGHPPTFVPTLRESFRRVCLGSGVKARLQELGLGFWDDASTGARRLQLLPNLLARNVVNDFASFKAAYEQAWVDVVDRRTPDPFANIKAPQLVITRNERPFAVPLTAQEGADPIYIQDRDSSQAVHIVDHSDLALLRLPPAYGRQVADLLATHLGHRLRRLSTAKVHVAIGGREVAPDIDGVPVLRSAADWILTLIAAIISVRSPRQVSGDALRRAAQRVRQIRVVVSDQIEVAIDDTSLKLSLERQPLPIDSSTAPLIFVASKAPDGDGDLPDVLAPAVMELVGYPALGADLRLGLLDCRAAGLRVPTATQLADLLQTSRETIAAVETVLRQPARQLLEIVVPLIAAYNVATARALWRAIDRFADEAGVREWLLAHSAEVDATDILTAAHTGDLDRARTSIGLELTRLNAAIRALGAPFAPLSDPDGIEREFRFFVSQRRDQIIDNLRLAFMDAFKNEQPLAEYAEVRTLSSLVSDVKWVDEYLDVPRPLMLAHVQNWIEVHRGIWVDDPSRSIEPLDDVRDANRVGISRMTDRALDIIYALHSSRGATVLDGLPSPQDVWELAVREAITDFEPLSEARIHRWLGTQDTWQGLFPATFDPVELGLDKAQLEEARRSRREGNRSRIRAERLVTIDGREFAASRDGYPEIVAAIRAGITDEFREAPAKPPSLVSPAPAQKRSGTGPRITASRQKQLSEFQKQAVGLAGEIAALEWLKTKYEGVTDDAWRSGFRNDVLGDGRGDDSLGYDFEVFTGRRRLLFEVKAMLRDAPEFDLTDGEIRAAQNVRRGEQFWILVIQWVLDSARRMPPIMLPNPFAVESADYYVTIGRGLTLRFALAQEHL